MRMVSERRMIAEKIPAYIYGTAEAAKSPISLKERAFKEQCGGISEARCARR